MGRAGGAEFTGQSALHRVARYLGAGGEQGKNYP